MALFDFNAIPGLGTAKETAERTFLWGRSEVVLVKSLWLNASCTDLNNTVTTELRPGLLLGQKTDGSFLSYAPTASDGSEMVAAVLSMSVKMLDLSGSTSAKIGVGVVGAPVRGSQLIKNVALSPTIDPQARGQMYGSYKFDDDLVGNQQPWKHTIAKTTSYTVLLTDYMTVFTTTGAGGPVTFTLPALLDANSNPQCKGFRVKFVNIAAQNMIVTAAAADSTKVVVINNSGATSVTFSTSSNIIGAVLEAEVNDDGTKWIFTVSNIPSGSYTVA